MAMTSPGGALHQASTPLRLLQAAFLPRLTNPPIEIPPLREERWLMSLRCNTGPPRLSPQAEPSSASVLHLGLGAAQRA